MWLALYCTLSGGAAAAGNSKKEEGEVMEVHKSNKEDAPGHQGDARKEKEGEAASDKVTAEPSLSSKEFQGNGAAGHHDNFPL